MCSHTDKGQDIQIMTARLAVNLAGMKLLQIAIPTRVRTYDKAVSYRKISILGFCLAKAFLAMKWYLHICHGSLHTRPYTWQSRIVCRK